MLGVDKEDRTAGGVEDSCWPKTTDKAPTMRSINAQLDRVQILSWAPRGRRPPLLKNYKIVRDSFVRCQTTTATYARSRQYQSITDDTKIFWQYQRLKGWLKPWKITIVADDKTGLFYEQVQHVLKHCRYYRFLIVEIAVDFRPSAGIDKRFVREHGNFGKSRRLAKRRKTKAVKYGSRKTGKFVRCYPKKTLGVFRVELELHSRLLRDISTLDDFLYLPDAVYPKHLQFVEFDWSRLEQFLRTRLPGECSRIIAGARRRSPSLQRVRRYLSRNGVVNIHRFLVPLAMNKEVSRALNRWARHFKKESLWASTK